MSRKQIPARGEFPAIDVDIPTEAELIALRKGAQDVVEVIKDIGTAEVVVHRVGTQRADDPRPVVKADPEGTVRKA